MNLWMRFDEEDSDMVHFSAKASHKVPGRRLIASIHVDDLDLMFGNGAEERVRVACKDGGAVFISVDLNVITDN